MQLDEWRMLCSWLMNFHLLRPFLQFSHEVMFLNQLEQPSDVSSKPEEKTLNELRRVEILKWHL